MTDHTVTAGRHRKTDTDALTHQLDIAQAGDVASMLVEVRDALDALAEVAPYGPLGAGALAIAADLRTSLGSALDSIETARSTMAEVDSIIDAMTVGQ